MADSPFDFFNDLFKSAATFVEDILEPRDDDATDIVEDEEDGTSYPRRRTTPEERVGSTAVLHILSMEMILDELEMYVKHLHSAIETNKSVVLGLLLGYDKHLAAIQDKDKVWDTKPYEMEFDHWLKKLAGLHAGVVEDYTLQSKQPKAKKQAAPKKAGTKPAGSEKTAPAKKNNTTTTGSKAYHTPTGKVYHTDRDCVLLSNAKTVKESSPTTAKKNGLRACKQCAA